MRAHEYERPCALLTGELDRVAKGFEAGFLEALPAWTLSIPNFRPSPRRLFLIVLTSNDERSRGEPWARALLCGITPGEFIFIAPAV